MDIIRDELIEFCRDMIRVQSYSGDEKLAINLIQDMMLNLGFDEIKIDKYGSIIGKIEGRGVGRNILLDGHVDTVGIGDRKKWEYDPFGAEIDKGRIYGRGTSDMKGSLSAMIYSASRFVDQRPAGDIYVSGTVYEEMYEGIALGNILKENEVDFVIIGEASNLNLNIGQKGRAEIKLRTLGKSCHSSNSNYGINAVYKMQSLISAINEMPLPNDIYLGEGIMELTDIISSPYPGTSVVPDECTVTYDRRMIVGESPESVTAQLLKIIGTLESLDSDFSAKIEIANSVNNCYTGEEIGGKRFFPSWYFDKEEIFVKTALGALRSIGLDSDLATYSFCTNGSVSAPLYNIPTLGFGPSMESQAHVCNEYIEIEQLINSAYGYIALVDSLTSIK